MSVALEGGIAFDGASVLPVRLGESGVGEGVEGYGVEPPPGFEPGTSALPGRRSAS